MNTRRIITALIFIPSLILSACQYSTQPITPTPSIPLTAQLSELKGGVEAKQRDISDFSTAQNGMTLEVNGAVRTQEDGRARLDLSSGTIVRVAPSSVFTLESNIPQDNSLATKIKLELGRIFIILKGGNLDIETPSGEASVRGSYLMVFVDPITLDVYLTCLEGDCSGENASGKIIFVTGQSVRLFHASGSNPPLPPIFGMMTNEDFQEWLNEVPEAKNILDKVFATLTAYPTVTATITLTPTITSTPTQTATPTETATLTVTATSTKKPTPLPTWTPSPVPTNTPIPNTPTSFSGAVVTLYPATVAPPCYLNFQVTVTDPEGLTGVEAIYTINGANATAVGMSADGPYYGSTALYGTVASDTISYYFKAVDGLGAVTTGGGGSIPADNCP
jgi:FecR-like protein